MKNELASILASVYGGDAPKSGARGNSSLYRKEMFMQVVNGQQVEVAEKAPIRRKLRKEFDANFSAIQFVMLQKKDAKQVAALQQLASAFNVYYFKTFAVNDFTLKSLTDRAMYTTGKNAEILLAFLTKCKELHEKSLKK